MNDTITIQNQIDDINRKLDLLLNYMQEQKLRSTAVDDLVSDLSIVGKDMYDTAVMELENRQVQLDPEEMKVLMIKLVKNIPTFVQLVDMLESIMDLAKDATPMVNEMIIDFTKKLHEFEQKGYFEFIKESGRIIDKVVTSYSTEDIRNLADNVVTILNTIKNLTQPEMLKAINNALIVFNSMEMEKLPEYSIWRVMREMNSPEMKKGMAFMVTFMKNLSKS
jgi:uncharacterized protein YjgD (DUF1641 family)